MAFVFKKRTLNLFLVKIMTGYFGQILDVMENNGFLDKVTSNGYWLATEIFFLLFSFVGPPFCQLFYQAMF